MRATVYGADSWGGTVGPLAGATVTIAGQTEITSDLGIAYLTKLPAGMHDAFIDRSGSEPAEARVSVVVGDTVDLIEELMPTRPNQGRIEVQVLRQESPGSPVVVPPEGVQVLLDRLTFRLTNEFGQADFPFASRGGHWVMASDGLTIPDSTLVILQGGDTARVTLRLLYPP